MTNKIRLRVPMLLAAIVGLAACVGGEAGPAAERRAGEPCPAWVYFPEDTHSNAPSPYLGCVNRANLESVVAQPKDLETGRPMGPASAEREAHGVRTYEEGKIKAFSDTSSPGPSIVLPGGSSGAQ